MSFFSSGGFGSNNQQNSGNTFGGFGQNNNNTNNATTGGFGTPNNTAFGAGNNASGSLFGGTTTNTGFGSGGFGSNTSNNNNAFGTNRPAFGATGTTTGGGLFGNNNNATTTSTGFGGVGNNTTSTGFGTTNNNSGGLFGQASSTFGNTSNTGGGLFGTPSTNTGFGSTAPTSTAFGTSTNTGFGGAQNQTPNQPPGTGGTPFQAHIEADGSGGAKAHFQSIAAQQPYQNFSFEELRMADYNQGRQWSNQGGQPGAFGTNTGFGGFGGNNNAAANATGGFGSSTTSTGFGSNNTSAFGSNTTSNPFGSTSNTTSSNLFGAAQPKPGGLFGSSTATSAPASGGLFGTASNTQNSGFGSGGFGSTNTTNNTTGGGLFGNNNNAVKPTFGFGTQNTSQPSAFGNNNATGGGLFGNTNTNANTGGGLFGNANNTTANNNTTTTTNAFGANNTGNSFGGFGSNNSNQTSGSSLFGGGFGNNNANNNQQKPGLFGGAPSGGLFGNNTGNQQPQAQQTSGGLFGSTLNSQQQNGGLFGNKPATTGTSLFGGANTNNTTGGGLFGNPTNQQPNQTGGLFGAQNQQKPGGLFGTSTTNNNTGAGLFGGLGQNNNNQSLGGTSLFGGAQNQQSPMNSSLFNSTQNQQQNQPQQLMTSINSTNPYGNEHLFVSLGATTPSVGPLVTPLSSSQSARKPAPLPQYKLNPSASSRLITPQKRTGYGFSYSSYGTPGSASSNASPSYGGLLGSGSLSRSLGKSLSTSNLRTSFSGGDSILAPGAFSPSGTRTYGSGSLKKLHINRNLRTDLFGVDNSGDAFRPSPLKKKVSFEGDTKLVENGEDHEADNSVSTALVRTEDRDSATPPATDQTAHRNQSSQSNGSSRPEMEQVKGNELAIVPEDGPAPAPAQRKKNTAQEMTYLSQNDQKPGAYYMKPTLTELRKMSRSQLASVKSFVVGREGSGKIEFGEVNLTDIDLDKIMGDIVQIETRSATVYHETAGKPAPGQKLNVPSTVTLGNSWPRARGGRIPVFEKKGPRYDKHILRLKRVGGTEFVDYNERTGEWTFRVKHFSTYALHYNDDDEDDSLMSSTFESPTARKSLKSTPARSIQDDRSILSDRSSTFNAASDDTFAWRNQKSLPGAFEDDLVSDDENHFLGSRGQSYESSLMASDNGEDASDHQHEASHARDENMTGSIPALDGPAETPFARSSPKKSILKTNQQVFSTFGATPPSQKGVIGDDWAGQLQRTVSPRKQNRQMLRDVQDVVPQATTRNEAKQPFAKFDKSINPFATSLDIMNSLFGDGGARIPGYGKKQSGEGKGFQV